VRSAAETGVAERHAAASAVAPGTPGAITADRDAPDVAHRGRPLPPIEAAERQALVKAILDNDGNMARAAIMLQVSRSTLYRRCRKLEIPHRVL